MVDLATSVFEGGGRGRTFVGEGNGIEAIEDRRARQDRGVDRGDRDVAIPGTHAVVLEQHRRQLPAEVEHRQPRACGDRRNQGRGAHPRRSRADADRFQRLDHDQRILAATDRYQRAMRQIERRRFASARNGKGTGSRPAPGRRYREVVRKWRAARKSDPPVEVDTIAIGELGEPVPVQRVEQVGQRRIQCAVLDLDRGRNAGLVIAHSGYQVQQPQSRIECLAALLPQRRRIGKTNALDQIRSLVERVHQLRHAIAVAAAHEPEPLRLARVDEHVHSITTDSPSERRL
jgi:hypothetical protein